MIRIFALLFTAVLLYSEETSQIQKEIYTQILTSLFPKKSVIKIWVENPRTLLVLNSIPFVHIVSKPKNADVLVIYKNSKILSPQNCNKIVLCESYKLIKKEKECITGGFFWHKGRPNIIFLEKNLHKHHLHLPKEMEQFIEDEL